MNDTLGFLRVAPRSARIGPRRANRVVARFKLAHDARVVGSVWTRSGVLVRRVGSPKLRAGLRAFRWNGRYRSGHLAYPGRYVFKVYARNAYGPVTLTQAFRVRR